MKEILSPCLVEHINEHVLLWFKNSNKYIILDKSLYELIEAFFNAENNETFKRQISELGFDTDLTDNYLKEINQLLEDCHIKDEEQNLADITFSSSQRNITDTYKIDDNDIRIHYGSEEIKQLIHLPLSHLKTKTLSSSYLYDFDIYEESGTICLFKDKMLLGTWPKTDTHLLQGKFAMQLLCTLHNNKEVDWMGTFHASAVSHNEDSFMIIGDSGKGKSTFTSILFSHGFEVLADDITPILAKDNFIYPYPAGISVKSGAFEVLKSRIPEFEKLSVHYINSNKGYVKYVPAPKSKGNLNGYPCKIMLSVNYQPEAKTQLVPMSFQDALAILIPTSWIEPSEENAQKFFSWINNIKFYQLTYSNPDEAVKEFSKLVKE